MTCIQLLIQGRDQSSLSYIYVKQTVIITRAQCSYVPYFPAYNARIIYTKRIWNRKKWTIVVYVRKISDR